MRTSSPINLIRLSFGLRLKTVHIRAPSKGVIDELISWPCRHRPAYNLKESLDPSPARATSGLLNKAWVILTMFGPVDAISKPSYPVYPERVIVKSTLSNLALNCDMKGTSAKFIPVTNFPKIY